MHFDLLTGIQPLALLLGTDALLLAFLAYPLVMRYPDDQGDGMALVLLPKPKLPSYWLVPAFGLLFLTLMVGYHSLPGQLEPRPDLRRPGGPDLRLGGALPGRGGRLPGRLHPRACGS